MKQMVKLTACILVILVSGCLFFESIDQPSYAVAGEIVIVSIDITTNGGHRIPYFGVCLPIGWTIPGDSIPCTGVYNETIYYDSLVAFEQDSVSPAPAGYYWWAGAGPSVMTDSGSVYGQLEIQTDSQLGLFSIDYMLGNDYHGVNQERSNNHLIGIVDEYTPRGLQAAVEGDLVVLNWTAPFIAGGLLGYNIYRDGQQFNSTLIVDTSFIDGNPLDGIHYYAVSSLYDDSSEYLMPYELPVTIGDLYVSPNGSNTNSGSSFGDALLTITYAMSVITPDSLIPITIFLAPGIYSPYTNGEQFPITFVSHVSLTGAGDDVTILDADSQNSVLELNEVIDVSINALRVTNGSSSTSGGGIHCLRANLSVENVIVANNYTVGFGGGIRCSDGSTLSLANVIISGNTALGDGGGISCWDSHSQLSLVNVTISDNSALYGGGICCDFYASLSLFNCILWNNAPQEIHVWSGSVTVTYSDIQGGWPGVGNIDTDPVFVSGPLSDYHLCPYTPSPCIDTGNPDAHYNDPENPLIPGYAMWPALGTIRNDMGVYGGPGTEVWVTGIEEHEIIQQVTTTLRISPNPFSKMTTISFGNMQGVESVELKIYDATGRAVKEFSHLTNNQIFWNGTDASNRKLPSGVYFLKLTTEDFTATHKLLLVR